ncbi:MAG: hypothetical protein AAGF45_01725 [Pseudomonadota bacterium]
MLNVSRTAAALAIAGAMTLTAAPSFADEPTATDITGDWSGKGFVQADENARKINVRCKIEGSQDETNVAFEGACRAMLVMKREIGARLVKEGDNYTGTYKGSEVGIAELNGERSVPDQLVLTMTFPREVNGDAVATMTIDHGDPNVLTITTQDEMESGVMVTTSQIVFERESKVAAK